MPMNKNALDVLNASLNLVYTLSGNIAGGALLTNILYSCCKEALHLL